MNRQERNEHTRRKILNASLKVFGKKGFHATRTDDLAIAAKVGKGTLYKHFESKFEIVLALFEQILDDLLKKIIQETEPFKSVKDSLERGIETYFDFFIKNKKSISVLMQTIGALSYDQSLRIHQIFFSKLKIFEDLGRKYLRKELREGIEIEDIILSIWGVLHIYGARWFFCRDSGDLMAKKDTICRILLYGITKKREKRSSNRSNHA